MVETSYSTGHSSRVPTIGDLIRTELDAGKSVRDLAAASGYRVKHQTFQELSKQQPKQFPKESKTVSGMAQALNCTESAVVLAYAAGLGIAVDSVSEFSLRMPAGVDDLAPEMKNALVSVVRAAVKQTEEQRAAPSPSLSPEPNAQTESSQGQELERPTLASRRTGVAGIVFVRGMPIDADAVFREMRANHNDMESGAEQIQEKYDYAGIKQGRARIPKAYFVRDPKIHAIDELYNQINPEVFGKTTIRLTVEEWRRWIDDLQIAMAQFDHANTAIQEKIVEVIPQSQIDQLEGSIEYIQVGISHDKIAADALEWLIKYWTEHEQSGDLIDVIQKADRLWESRPGMYTWQQRNLDAVQTELSKRRAAVERADSEDEAAQRERDSQVINEALTRVNRPADPGRAP
ncbi:hypothetical protein BKG77_07170 [Mycobacteroides chelonae]|nr:hypothetical protein BKG77_07170 [Mycobacteroides chelonae]